MPERIRALLRGTRRRTGSGPVVGFGVGIVIAVLIATVAISTLLTTEEPAPAAADPGSGAAKDLPPLTPAPTSASPTSSPSKSASPTPTAKPTKSTGEPAPTTKDDPTTDKAATSPTYPGGGTYRIRPAHTGMCLGIGPEINNEARTVLVQDSCAQAAPALTTVKVNQDTVRFTMYFANDDWFACLGQDSPGELYAARDCNGGSLQTFKLVSTGDGRYLIKSTASGLCMDFPWYSTTEGAQVGAAKCASGSASQRFSFS